MRELSCCLLTAAIQFDRRRLGLSFDQSKVKEAIAKLKQPKAHERAHIPADLIKRLREASARKTTLTAEEFGVLVEDCVEVHRALVSTIEHKIEWGLPGPHNLGRLLLPDRTRLRFA